MIFAFVFVKVVFAGLPLLQFLKLLIMKQRAFHYFVREILETFVDVFGIVFRSLEGTRLGSLCPFDRELTHLSHSCCRRRYRYSFQMFAFGGIYVRLGRLIQRLIHGQVGVLFGRDQGAARRRMITHRMLRGLRAMRLRQLANVLSIIPNSGPLHLFIALPLEFEPSLGLGVPLLDVSLILQHLILIVFFNDLHGGLAPLQFSLVVVLFLFGDGAQVRCDRLKSTQILLF